MRVCATILSFNDPASTRAVVEAVRSQTRPPDGIVVVENGYPSGLRETHGFHVEHSSTNRGVGWGHNEAVTHATRLYDPDWFWLLEHDTLPDPDCLADLCDHRGDIPGAQALVPTLARNEDERDLARTWSAARAAKAPASVAGTYVFDALTFNALLLSRDAVERVGPFREDFFVGHEDWDFTQRMLDAGMLIAHRVEPTGIHASWGDARHGVDQSALRRYYSIRNSLRLALDRRDHVTAARIMVRNVGGAALGNNSLARLQATLDGVRGRLGERRA